MTRRWHDEHDSVVGTVAIPAALKEVFTEYLINAGIIDGHADLTAKTAMPHVNSDDLVDLCSDLSDEDGPLPDVARRILRLAQSEFNCGYIHIRYP